MTLTRAQIIDAAHEMVRDHGLAGLSMRRIATVLDVQAGALYYHVASKQDILVAVGTRILQDCEVKDGDDPAQLACNIRASLLTVRDGAEIVSFAYAYKPQELAPFNKLEQLLIHRGRRRAARRTAHTLICYTLGFVGVEQNHAELRHADVISGRRPEIGSAADFRFGAELILSRLI